MPICSVLFSFVFLFCVASVFLISCQREGEYHTCYISNKDVALLWEHVLQMQNVVIQLLPLHRYVGSAPIKNTLEGQPRVSPRGPRGCPSSTAESCLPCRDFQLLSWFWKDRNCVQEHADRRCPETIETSPQPQSRRVLVQFLQPAPWVVNCTGSAFPVWEAGRCVQSFVQGENIPITRLTMINVDCYFMTTAAVSSSEGQDSIALCKDAFLRAAASTQRNQKHKGTSTGRESLSLSNGGRNKLISPLLSLDFYSTALIITYAVLR